MPMDLPRGEMHGDFLSKDEENQMRSGFGGQGGGFVSIPIGNHRDIKSPESGKSVEFNLDKPMSGTGSVHTRCGKKDELNG
jgi:hypothetical protein